MERTGRHVQHGEINTQTGCTGGFVVADWVKGEMEAAEARWICRRRGGVMHLIANVSFTPMCSALTPVSVEARTCCVVRVTTRNIRQSA